MAAPVSPEFKAAQSRRTRHPKKEVFIVGRNMASPTRGASIVSSGDFSADYPAAGAIDGDRTHINYGPAAGADNGKGRSGWRSTSAAVEGIWDEFAEFYDHALIESDIQANGWAGDYVTAHRPSNIHQWSETLDVWIRTGLTVTADDEIAPDGTLTADRMVEAAGGGQHGIFRNFNRSANALIPISIFAKAGTGPTGRNWIYLQVDQNDGINYLFQWFDVLNGTVGTTTAQGTGWTLVPGSARIRPVRNRPGWFRCEAVVQGIPAGGTTRTGYVVTQSDGSLGYGGIPGNYLHMWGAQAEDGGATVSPYSKTTITGFWATTETFDPYVPATPLAGQGAWVAVSTTGNGKIDVEAIASRTPGGQGVELDGPAPAADLWETRLPFPLGVTDPIVIKWWHYMNNPGWTTDNFKVILEAAGVPLLGYHQDAVGVVVGLPAFMQLQIAGGTPFPLDDEALIQHQTWFQCTFILDRSPNPATTRAKFFWKAEGDTVQRQGWEGIVDTTGLDSVMLHIQNLNPASNPTPNFYVDDLEINPGYAAESFHSQVLDLGVVPSGVGGEMTLEDTGDRVDRLVLGAIYPTINRDPSPVPIRDVVANTARVQTFTPTTKQPITHVTFELGSVGAPAGNIWVEILRTSGGIPVDTDVLARSLKIIPRVSMQANVTRQRFTFPAPMIPDGVSTYGYRVMGDWPIDGANYIAITDDPAGTYAGGQAFTWDGTTYTPLAATDHPFVTWSNQIPLEQFDTGTEDTDLKINASASQHWLAQGFEVDREKDALYLNISVKALLPHNIQPDGVEYWIDIHADDGTGTKPSNEILAIGARTDPQSWAWTSYAWAGFRLVAPFKFRPGVKYWWVLKATSNVLPGQPASEMLAFGADDSSPAYTRGNRAISNDANPKVWTAIPGGAMPFRIMEEERPYWYLEAAFSSDDVYYGAPEMVDGNGERAAEVFAEFTGAKARYWMARAIGICPGVDRAFSPVITSLTEKAVFVTPKTLTLDFGQVRSVDLVRIFGHPTTGGIDTFKVSKSDDDVLYTDIEGSEYRLETVESYAAGEVDDQGVTIRTPITWTEDFQTGYTPDVELAGQQGWYQTAAHIVQAGNTMQPKLFGLYPPFDPAAIDVEILRFTPASPLEYAKPHEGGGTNSAYVFEWWERKGAQNLGEVTSLRFAGGADSGSDAWECKWSHISGGANVSIVDAFGDSGTIFVATSGYTKLKIEVDPDLTLRFYVRNPTPPEDYVLYYTGRVSQLAVDRTIIRAYNAAISFQSYDWWRFEEVIDPAAITIGGTYFGGQFAESHAMRYLKLTMLDSNWEYAEILELQAFRVVDVSERVVSMSDSRSADFLQLRLKQKTLDLVLQNQDRALSTRNTAGPYYGDLGGGAEIVAYVGYEGVADMVKTGVFYVDEWNESARSAEVTIGGTDGVKVLDQDVAPNYKQNFGYIEMIEYFANLANYPSQWVATDRAAGTIDFFADSKANSWDEIQKIGEAASFSRVWVDRNGRLRMRLTGSSAADLRLSTFLATDEFRRSEGPPVFIGDKMYVSVIVETDLGGGLQQQLKVVEYDLITKVWQYVAGGQAINTVNVGEEHGFSIQVVFNGELYVFVHYQPMGTLGLRVVKWNGGYVAEPTAFSIMFERVDGAFGIVSKTAGLGATRTIFPSVTLRNWFLTFDPEPTQGFHYRFNLHDFRYLITFGVQTVEGAVVVDEGEFGDEVYFSNTTGSGYPPTEGRWSFAKLIFESMISFPAPEEKKQLFFFNLTPYLHVGGRVFSMGMDVDDSRNLITSLVGREGPSIPGRIWRQHIDTRAIDYSPNAYDPAFASVVDNSRDGLAVVWADDLVLAANERTVAHKELHLLQWDTKANEIVDAGNISLSNTRLITFSKRTLRGQNVVYGIADEGRVVEIYLRRKLPIQSAPVFEVIGESDGEFENASLQAGDDDGESRIINAAIVKSEPLSVLPTEQVWKGSRLPWPVSVGTRLEFGVNLREMAVPFDAANPDSQRITMTDSGFTKTIELSSHHKRPKILIEFTGGPVAGGLVETIEINGETLKKNETLIAYVFGNADSIERWGIRQREIDNDYIYDSFAQSLVGAAAVQRFQYERARVGGVNIRALWELEEFDLGTIRELSNLFIDSTFYIVTITRQYHGAQVMTLGVEEGIV
jgi:hypothetical protein